MAVSCSRDKVQNDEFFSFFIQNCQKSLRISINLFTFAPERKSLCRTDTHEGVSTLIRLFRHLFTDSIIIYYYLFYIYFLQHFQDDKKITFVSMCNAVFRQ